jgi:hypothetical protein
MNRIRRTACALLGVGMTAGSAFAQKPPAAATSAPTPATAPAPAAPPAAQAAAPAAPAASPAAPEAPPPEVAAPPPIAAPPTGRIACLVGDHPREYSDSARTATGLVCDALREQGIDVGTAAYDPAGSHSAYVVNLDQLGSTFFLRVTYEEPIGVAKKTRRVSLYDLSEAEVAAPRVAHAMTDAKSVDDTANYDNVVGSERREKEKKSGEFVIGAGIAALSMPAAGSYMGPMLNVFGFYETREWGIGLQGHIGDAAMKRADTASYMAFSVGARYYFSDQNITPLFGGGLALSSIQESKPGNYYQLTGSGTAAYVEGGVEFFRLHKTHLIATLRVDAPFYSLGPSSYYSGYNYSSSVGTTSAAPAPSVPKDRYEVPITLNFGVGF